MGARQELYACGETEAGVMASVVASIPSIQAWLQTCLEAPRGAVRPLAAPVRFRWVCRAGRVQHGGGFPRAGRGGAG